MIALPVLAVVVSGCSQSLHVGSAATVGSARISEETVREQVAQSVALTGRAPSGALARAVLGNLINQRLVEDLATRFKVVASGAAVRAEFASLESQAGSLASLRSEAAGAGIPPSQLDSAVRDIVIEADLERLFGTQAKLSTTQEQGALSAALTAEDKAAHVDVSPRFGHFVDGQVVADPSAALASPAPRSASTGG